MANMWYWVPNVIFWWAILGKKQSAQNTCEYTGYVFCRIWGFAQLFDRLNFFLEHHLTSFDLWKGVLAPPHPTHLQQIFSEPTLPQTHKMPQTIPGYSHYCPSLWSHSRCFTDVYPLIAIVLISYVPWLVGVIMLWWLWTGRIYYITLFYIL